MRSVAPLGVQTNAILLTPEGSLSKGFDGFHQKPQYSSVGRVGKTYSIIAGSWPEGKPMGYSNWYTEDGDSGAVGSRTRVPRPAVFHQSRHPLDPSGSPWFVAGTTSSNP